MERPSCILETSEVLNTVFFLKSSSRQLHYCCCKLSYLLVLPAEDWWIEYLVRHPLLLPYTSGLKRLDKIYLDTSWGYQACSQKFPSKVCCILGTVGKEGGKVKKSLLTTWFSARG